MRDQLSELEGRELGCCWCEPYFCHGKVLLELAREMKDEREEEERKRKESEAKCICDPNGAQNLLCKHADVSIV